MDITVSGIPAGESVAVTWSEPTTAASPRLASRQYLAATTSTSTPGVDVSCSVADCTLTQAQPHLVLTATVTDDVAHDLVITLVPSSGIDDPDPSDNSTTIHLQPAPPPPPTPYDVSVTAEEHGNSGKWTAVVAGLPTGFTGTLTVSIAGTFDAIPAGCTDINFPGGLYQCSGISNGSYDFDVHKGPMSGEPTFHIEVDGDPTTAGYAAEDSNPSNNDWPQ